MAFSESWHLAAELLSDPTSHAAAAVADWSYPMSTEARILADLFDVTVGIAAGRKRPKSYPRPWDAKPKRFGSTTRPREEVLAILATRGHGPQAPTRDANGRIHGPDGRYRKG